MRDNLELIQSLRINLKETEKKASKSNSQLEEKLRKMEERADGFEFKLAQQHTFIQQQRSVKAKDSSSSSSSLQITVPTPVPEPAPTIPLEEFVILKQEAQEMNEKITEANTVVNTMSQLQKTHSSNIANISQTIQWIL